MRAEHQGGSARGCQFELRCLVAFRMNGLVGGQQVCHGDAVYGHPIRQALNNGCTAQVGLADPQPREVGVVPARLTSVKAAPVRLASANIDPDRSTSLAFTRCLIRSSLIVSSVSIANLLLEQSLFSQCYGTLPFSTRLLVDSNWTRTRARS
jgi:hypothetical protein